MEVSWSLYAERNDVYLQNRPHLREAEQAKSARDQGKYQFPADYGQPEEKEVRKALMSMKSNSPSSLKSAIGSLLL